MSLFIACCESYLKGWESQSDEYKEQEGKECREAHPKGINLMIIAKTDLTDGTFSPSEEFKKRDPIFVTFDQLTQEFLSGECPTSLLGNISKVVQDYDPNKTLVWLFMLVDVEKDGGIAESALYTTPINERYRT